MFEWNECGSKKNPKRGKANIKDIKVIVKSKGKDANNIEIIIQNLFNVCLLHKTVPLRKWKNRITVEFQTPDTENNNQILIYKGYEIFIPNSNLSC